MNIKNEIEQVAIAAVKNKNWKYHECLGARRASEIDLEFVTKIEKLPKVPANLWTVPFEIKPESQFEVVTHNLIVVYVDAETLKCYLH